MRILKVLSFLLVGSMLLVASASAFTNEEAATRWSELQATGINAEQVILNLYALYAAGDLDATEVLQVVLTAPDQEEALRLLLVVARSKGQLQPTVDAAVDAALSNENDLSMEPLLVAADAAGPDALELVVIAAIERGATGVLSSAFLQSQVIAEAALPTYLINNGASPSDVQSALTSSSSTSTTTIKPDRVTVSPVK